MAKEIYEIVRCPTCFERVQLRKGHEERDMQEHMLECQRESWTAEGIINNAIWGR